ncbi:MAG: glycoside hydrolase family 25 protein [Chloroflexota bacterium]|nr:glycoside hydrolase family 25 protein [Chloroflexota bacterium]
MNRHSRARSALRPLLLLALAGVIFLAGGPGVAAAQLSYARAAHLEGIDVSHWQGYVRWRDVRRVGVAFAIVKATEGQLFVDSRYARNRSKADALGLPFSAYHFARPDRTYRDAVREANHFVRTAKLAGRHLLPVLDLEVTGGLTRRELIGWVRKWLSQVESRLGVKPMIYTSPAFWRDRMGDTRWFADNGYRLWIAHWHVNKPRVPAANWGGRGWTLWQVTNCARVAGIRGCVDGDFHRGLDLRPLLITRNR